MKKIFLTIIFLSLILFTENADSQPRSSEWPKLRKAHLLEHPNCEVCGSRKDLEVHHIKPVHLYPQLELDPDNLITLCKSKYWGFDCHLIVGHGGSYQRENPWVREDAKYIHEHGPKASEEYIKEMIQRVKSYNKAEKKKRRSKSFTE